MNETAVQLEVIGRVHSCFTEKFGIPRQPGRVPASRGRIEMMAPFDRDEMFKGLESFSHIWVHFLFHQLHGGKWQPTVRPPRLGGKTRVGIFGTRSPHRPNRLGLSVVRLVGVVRESGRLFIDISGIDLLDGTPVVDIKPYVPYSDSVADASSGFVQPDEKKLPVEFSPAVVEFCHRYEASTGRELMSLIRQVVEEDPRPASQRSRGKTFGMHLWDLNVRWRPQGDVFLVDEVGFAATQGE